MDDDICPDQTTNDPEHGFALLAIIGFLFVLSAVLVPFVSSARVRTLAAANSLEEFRFQLALSSLNFLVAKHLASPKFNGANGNTIRKPTQFHCAFDRAILDIHIQEHSGLIDLNVASIELLQLGLSAAGLDAAKSLELAKAIGQNRALNGDQNAPSIPSKIEKEIRFEEVAELYDFPTFRSLPLGRLMRIFTVDSKSAIVSSSSLSAMIKSALTRFPGASEEMLATATLGSDVFTIESVFRQASTNYHAAGVFRTGASDTGDVRLINSLPFYTGETEESGAGESDCSEILDADTVALFKEVF